MARRRYPSKKLRKGIRPVGVNPNVESPTEAVFRIDLATGEMRITDQKGDKFTEDDDVTPAKIKEYGIETENSKLLAVLFYAKCNAKHGGCVFKIVNGQQVLVW
jgi:hypothetical protein